MAKGDDVQMRQPYVPREAYSERFGPRNMSMMPMQQNPRDMPMRDLKQGGAQNRSPMGTNRGIGDTMRRANRAPEFDASRMALDAVRNRLGAGLINMPSALPQFDPALLNMQGPMATNPGMRPPFNPGIADRAPIGPPDAMTPSPMAMQNMIRPDMARLASGPNARLMNSALPFRREY